MKKLLVLYKTHLDIGFTDFAKNIVELYLKEYIPNAINTAIALNEGGEKKFVWQTGSWILNKYLKSVSGEELKRAEYAIENDFVSWHGLPFTAHTELFTSELLNYAIGISKGLDKKYSKRTIAVKATDVPGMTKAMIKPLVVAGVRFLHIGVNPASSLPNVPPMFRWRNDEGEELIVMYNGDYGEYTQISDECAVMFRFAGDNCAPMKAESVTMSFEHLKERYPGTQIISATLNDLALEVEKIRDTLPIVDAEIGDSWIHGVMTDPRKVFSYHALLHHAKKCDEKVREKMYESLLLVPEHTWGLDEKITIADTASFGKQSFFEALDAPKFKRFEKSWQEQRDYISAAILDETAKKLVSEYKRDKIKLSNTKKALPNGLEINEYGEIVSLKLGDRILADAEHPLCSFVYEQFSENEYDRFFKRYNRSVRNGVTPLKWMVEDFTKIGMSSGVDKYYRYRPTLSGIAFDGNTVAVDCSMPIEAYERFGCPREIQYVLTFEGDRINIDFAWFDKDKNRMAEAMWLIFSPIVKNQCAWRIEKLGQLISPFYHVTCGGVQDYTSGIVKNEEIQMSFPDGALITFGKPDLLEFDDTKITGECVSVNLYNNVWGTNFPMWYGEDGRIRIKIDMTQE